MADEKVVVDDDDDVESEEDDDVEEDDVEEEDRSQDRDPHFAGACAVEMHVDISPRVTLYGNLQEKCAAQIEPKAQTHTHTDTLCEPARSKRRSRFDKSHHTEIYR